MAVGENDKARSRTTRGNLRFVLGPFGFCRRDRSDSLARAGGRNNRPGVAAVGDVHRFGRSET